VIGYPIGQDGALLPDRDTGFVPQGKFIMFWCFIPYNQDGWILALFFFCVFVDLDFVLVPKHAKKELGQYPVILTTRLVNTPYIFVVTVCNFIFRGPQASFLAFGYFKRW